MEASDIRDHARWKRVLYLARATSRRPEMVQFTPEEQEFVITELGLIREWVLGGCGIGDETEQNRMAGIVLEPSMERESNRLAAL